MPVAKRILALAALVSCVCSAQTLIFKSGFENNTTIGALPNPSTNTSGYTEPLTGTDSSTGYSWPITLWAPREMGVKVGGGCEGSDCLDSHHYSFSFETETGHTGASTRAMRLNLFGFTGSPCCPQYVFQSAGLTQPMQSVYYSIWLKYPSSFATLLNSGSQWGAELHGWKTNDDFKETLGVTRPGSSGTTIHANTQSNSCGTHSSSTNVCPYTDPITGGIDNAVSVTDWVFDSEENLSYSIPIGQWFHVEIYETRVHGPGGVKYIAIDGHVIGKHVFPFSYGWDNEEIKDFYWTNLYDTAIYPQIQDYDDMEVWDSPPCGTFPCQTQVGGEPPDFRGWQGAVGAVGVPFNFQPLVTGSPTSYQTCCGSMPPGLSQNSSTGSITGTPTTAGKYKFHQQAFNATGKASQPIYIQVNSSVTVPVIKTFGAYPATVASGSPSTLYSDVIGAGTVTMSIDQGVGPVANLSDSKTVNPTISTTYTLRASNSAGSTTKSSTVSVSGSPVPTISSFTATPATIPPGASSTLAWSTSGATSLSLNQGIGSVTGTTSRAVSPSITMTYTLTATNAAGSVNQPVTVTVTSGSGPVRYISSAGSDSNSGSDIGHPWQTIGKASAGPYAAGTQILFKCGDNFSGSTLSAPSNGTSTAPIIYGHYSTTASCPNLPIFSAITTNNKDYLTIDGLQIQNSGTLVNVQGSNGIRFVNNVMKNGSFRGLGGASGVGTFTADHNTYILESGHTMTSHAFFVQVSGSPSVTMTNNFCDVSAQAPGQATICFTSFGGNATMQYNISHGAQQAFAIKPIDGTGCTPPAVTSGLIADNFADGASTAGGNDGETIELQGCAGNPQSGITVARNVLVCRPDPNGSTDALGLFQSSNNTIVGNLMIGPCPTATSTPRVIHQSSGSTGNKYYNNTIVSATTASASQGIDMDSSSGSDVAKNNLFKRLTYGIRNNAGGNVTEDYNVFESDVTTPTQGTMTHGGHSRTSTAAGFVTGSGIDPNNYKLTAGAAALTGNVNLGAPYDVILGSSASAYPYGAYTQTSTWIAGAFGGVADAGPGVPRVKISGSSIVGGTVTVQ